MVQPQSIRFQLSAAFSFFVLLVLVLGLFSIGRLSDFNQVSGDIRDVLLPNTRVLGDLNNYTSDFRAAEGRYLLSSTPAEAAASEREMQQLDGTIARSMGRYGKIAHTPADAALYSRFVGLWNDYRSVVGRIIGQAHENGKSQAVQAYQTTSQEAYNTADAVLEQLTERNVGNIREATARAERAYVQARWLIAAAVLCAAALGAAALFYVRHRISDPLLYLAARMHRLADNKTDIDIQGTDRSDEIGEMARAVVVFRNNAVELMLTQRGLAQQASMLEERLAHEQGLTQLQRNFVAMASHEFRTPLTIIDGHAQRLIRTRGKLEPEETAERASKIRAAVLRVTSLIENLLNSAQLVEGGCQLYFHPDDLDAAQLLRDVCQLHREIAPGSQIIEDFGDGPLWMLGDGKLLFQMFSNLLSNAIKYSPHGSSISVKAGVDDDHLVAVVQDRGVGIPEGESERVFQRYYRGSNVSGIVGTGVGLYLVKMVVDLHGGDISVVSREGEGSCFTVRLPVRRSVAAALSQEPAPRRQRAYR